MQSRIQTEVLDRQERTRYGATVVPVCLNTDKTKLSEQNGRKA